MEKKVIPTTSFSLTNNITGIIGFGDLHIEVDALSEIKGIIEEICQIGKENSCNICFQLGDYCDKGRLYATELYSLSENTQKLKDSFNFVGILKGNHDVESTESSVIDFLEFLGVNICNDETMLETPFGKVLLGHWFLKESNDAFGTWQRYTLEELKKKYVYDHCLIGHQHDFQKLDEKTYHLGSSRYVAFGEKPSIKKKCFILNKDGLKFIELKSVIPMCNVSSLEELQKLPDRTKVRYIFKSFDNLKNEIQQVDKVKDRFHSFKKKLDFSTINPILNLSSIQPDKNIKKEEIIKNWLERIKDEEVKRILTEEFNQYVA